MPRVEVLTVGNEILLGLTEDTNSSYLCRVVRATGSRVAHIAVVGDDLDAIAEAIQASIERGSQLVFTSGGLGPTDDDLTLAGVAKATGRKLELNPEARMFVEQRYKELASQGYVSSESLGETRLKMALLPEGAQPIANPVGAAPAMVLIDGATRIVSLPGVPTELKSIVEGTLPDTLRDVLGEGVYRERRMTVRSGDESVLAPALGRVASNHPEVYLKSRAKHFGPDVTFRILICASGTDAEHADQLIESTAADLRNALEEIGVREDE